MVEPGEGAAAREREWKEQGGADAGKFLGLAQLVARGASGEESEGRRTTMLDERTSETPDDVRQNQRFFLEKMTENHHI